jgi:hypothetical protein
MMWRAVGFSDGRFYIELAPIAYLFVAYVYFLFCYGAAVLLKKYVKYKGTQNGQQVGAILWGIIAGGSGGLIIFLVGAFFGAFVGGTVGAVALPAFAVFHRVLKRGDVMEYKHFLPLALGVTLTICSFILGL